MSDSPLNTHSHSIPPVEADSRLNIDLFHRDVDIWMPEMEQQEVPAGWWDTEADRSLLAGVFKHGRFSLCTGIYLYVCLGFFF